MTIIESALRKIYLPAIDGCWLWRGTKTSKGYGKIICQIEGYRYMVLAHRFFYEHFIGEIPEGLEIDHLCHNTICVNPAHLEAVTHSENLRREHAFRPKTHCPQGHEYTPENTYKTPSGKRQCRICGRTAVRKYHKRKGDVI